MTNDCRVKKIERAIIKVNPKYINEFLDVIKSTIPKTWNWYYNHDARDRITVLSIHDGFDVIHKITMPDTINCSILLAPDNN